MVQEEIFNLLHVHFHQNSEELKKTDNHDKGKSISNSGKQGSSNQYARNGNGKLLALASENEIKVVYCKSQKSHSFPFIPNDQSTKSSSKTTSALPLFKSSPNTKLANSTIAQSINGGNTSSTNCWFVGSTIYSKPDNGKICKILWHPLSSTNSHLLVLSSNGILRMFNLAQDIEEPEQM